MTNARTIFDQSPLKHKKTTEKPATNEVEKMTIDH